MKKTKDWPGLSKYAFLYVIMLLAGAIFAQTQSIGINIGPIFPLVFVFIGIAVFVWMFAYITSNEQLIMLVKSELSEFIVFSIMFVVILEIANSGYLTFILGNISEFVYDKIANTSPSTYSSSFPPTGYSATSPSSLISSAQISLEKNKVLLSVIFSNHLDFSEKISMKSSMGSSIGGALSGKPELALDLGFLSAGVAEKYTGGYGKADEAVGNLVGKSLSASSVTSLNFCSGFAFANPLMGEISTLVNQGFMGIFFQKALLENLASPIAITVILAVGFILRAIPFSRGAGALILAVGVSLYVIMPFSILIMNDAINGFYEKAVPNSGSSAPYENSFSNYVDSKYNLMDNDLGPGITSFAGGPACKASDSNAFLRKLQNKLVGGSFDYMLSFPFMVILAQALSLLGFVSITGGIAKIFGAEISPFIIGRLIQYLK